ncbi:MAG: oligosaccharide flippase family protein [Hellea sp.]|nr:oligosaccharide flippase family protein [Hellea sp.]
MSFLLTGSIVSQLIPLLLTPIITRLYTPEDFGLYAFFLSVCSITAVGATARIESLILIPKSKRSIHSLLSLGYFFLVAYVMIVILVMAGSSVFNYDADIKAVMPWIAIFVFLSGSGQFLRAVNFKRERYKIISVSDGIMSSGIGLSQIAMSLLKLPSGLMVGNIIGIALYNLFLGLNSLADISQKVSFQRMRVFFRKYVRYCAWGVLSGFSSRVAQESLVLFMFFMGSKAEVGYIALISRLIGLPTSIIATNIGDLLYRRLCDKKRHEYKGEVSKAIMLLVGLSCIFNLGVYVIAKNFLTLIFGENWAPATDYLGAFVILYASSFVYAPLSKLYALLNMMHLDAIWQLTWLGTNLIIFGYAYLYELPTLDLVYIVMIKQSILSILGVMYVYTQMSKTSDD